MRSQDFGQNLPILSPYIISTLVPAFLLSPDQVTFLKPGQICSLTYARSLDISPRSLQVNLSPRTLSRTLFRFVRLKNSATTLEISGFLARGTRWHNSASAGTICSLIFWPLFEGVPVCSHFREYCSQWQMRYSWSLISLAKASHVCCRIKLSWLRTAFLAYVVFRLNFASSYILLIKSRLGLMSLTSLRRYLSKVSVNFLNSTLIVYFKSSQAAAYSLDMRNSTKQYQRQ